MSDYLAVRNAKCLADWRLRRALGVVCIDAWGRVQREYLDQRLAQQRRLCRPFLAYREIRQLRCDPVNVIRIDKWKLRRQA
jgi:hypothetical protein